MQTVKHIHGEELFEKVQAKLGANRGLLIVNGMLIPKYRFDCVNVSLHEHKRKVALLEQNLTAANERIADYERLRNACEAAETELLILRTILAEKPKNCFAVRALIECGKLTGSKLVATIRKELKRLRQSEPYLFYGEDRTFRLVPVSQSAFTELTDE